MIITKYATYAFTKKSLEKFRLAGIGTLSPAIPVQRWQANWELVIKLFRNIPGKVEEEMTNEFHIFELQDENINAKKIIAVKYSTYATARNEAGDGKLYLFMR